ncbi:MAG: MalY/PatB family protein [uncultured Clostridium sp.]
MNRLVKCGLENRIGSHCLKWDGLRERFGNEDLIAMWVADMDFKTPQPVIDALKERVEHGIFGYHMIPDSYYESFINWEKEKHGYDVKREWIRFSPGVVPALFWFINILTNPGDSCIVMGPVYYPFHHAIEENNRKLIFNNLKNNNGIYTIDFESFERDIIENKVKLFILSSPHNPVGRVWTKEELKKALDICKANNVFVLADEIHQDIIIGDKKQIPAATVGDYDNILVTLTAATKTFNLAACQNSFVIIPDNKIRERFDEYFKSIGGDCGNIFGYIAVEAAYRYGEEWLNEILAKIKENYEYTKEILSMHLPHVVISPLEGTYLAWYDFSYYINEKDIKNFFQYKCNLAVDYGSWFGEAGKGHIRINLATERKIVEEAMNNIIKQLL